MAEICKDINEGLAQLNAAINRVNTRLNNLEKKQNECCDKNSNDLNALKSAINQMNSRLNDLEKKQNDNPNDLSAILKRLKKAETDILELGGVVRTVIDDLKDILDSLNEHNQNANESQNIFSGILNFFINE
ncbi:hypothetical protein [Nostoc sp. CCY 9925]|uniref:hypothetical protein n=1 Tax=Nostoc sp. CCY 9925 TaxID=3103865 RepID=UPI0039C6353A